MVRVIDPSISTWPDAEPQLVGSTCGWCAATVFPAQADCPRCSRSEMREALLPRRGTVVAWTTQGFVPGEPFRGPVGKDFVPFGVGLIQLGNVVRVEGRLTEHDPARLSFGMDVELTMIPLATDDHGEDVLTFAFRPI